MLANLVLQYLNDLYLLSCMARVLQATEDPYYLDVGKTIVDISTNTQECRVASLPSRT